MKEALLEYEKKFKYPSKLLYEPCLPCYGCLKRVLLENLAMVHSRALYGGDPWDNVYENYNEDEFPFALGGELAEKRRCKACDKKSGGAFSRYAKGVRADILREEAEELADVRRELGGGF